MTRFSRALHYSVYLALAVLCNGNHHTKEGKHQLPEHGDRVMEFKVGREISNPSILTTRKKRAAIVPISNSIRMSFLLRIIKDILFINLMLCGDIAVNPGPLQSTYKLLKVSKRLKMCHWNIQRLTDGKLEELRVILAKTETDLDILSITETFCSRNVPDSFYGIPGYDIHRKDRIGKAGGGILAYVKNSLLAKRRDDLEVRSIEVLWLEICPYKSKRPLFVAGVYRPPSYKVR